MAMTVTHSDRAVSNSPIIGVLTQPLSALNTNTSQINASSFIPASHVKFLESGGARIVPVDYDVPQNKLYKLLDQLNGLYIPGDS